MSTLTAPSRLAQLPLVPDGASIREPLRPPEGGGRLTLEQRLDRVWEDLLAAGAAECPLCGSEMSRAPGADGGRCTGCGTKLA